MGDAPNNTKTLDFFFVIFTKKIAVDKKSVLSETFFEAHNMTRSKTDNFDGLKKMYLFFCYRLMQRKKLYFLDKISPLRFKTLMQAFSFRRQSSA